MVSEFQRFRASVAERPTLNLVYRIVVGVVGVAVLAAGIVAIPYPGPGWLIVFAGLGILATEFVWAHRLLQWTRERYRRVMDWYAGRGLIVKTLGALLTVAVVLLTLWLLNTFGAVGHWFGLDVPWLHSPLF
ncbi:TIGR02611 family protein [Nocardia blacklockiae]|uniref:TIGR02611 family protein n=1 Tax=Nocardia blacklockiae TaxID=480036 RepID=UPI0018941A40|nr:TIGR02611 family protein [Nocardia blacklockiae]MBF6170205.1 TIGR02611 family protein [Nocardia blacklockiae]